LLERSHYEIEELKLNFQEQSSSLHLHRDVWMINLKFDNRRTKIGYKVEKSEILTTKMLFISCFLNILANEIVCIDRCK
jgi:hypothetical protein